MLGSADSRGVEPECAGALKRMFAKTEKPMRATAYVTRAPSKVSKFSADLEAQLASIQRATENRLTFRVVDTSAAEAKSAAKDAGCLPMPFGDADADVTTGFMCIAFEYGASRDAIKFLPPDRAEGNAFWIANKMQELRDKEDGVKRKVGVLTGHGEIRLSEPNLLPASMGKPSLVEIIGTNFPTIVFPDVDLRAGEAEIDAALDGLIITQPSTDLSEKELRRIDDFVMKGKSLAVFASAVNVKPSDPLMVAELSTHGLERLLDGYGIELHKDAVIDFGRSYKLALPTQNGPVTARMPQILDVAADERFTSDETLLDTKFTPFFRIESVAVPFASSLALHAEKQPGARIRIVMRSTPRAQRESTPTVDLGAFRAWRPKGDWAQHAVAAVAEGKLTSAFPGGDPRHAQARVFVVASSQFLANPFARAGNPPSSNNMAMGATGDEKLLTLAGVYAQSALTNTILVLKNTLDWMSHDDDLAKCATGLVPPAPTK